MRRFHNNNFTIVNLVDGRSEDPYGADFVVFQGNMEIKLGVGKNNDVTLDFSNGDIIVKRVNRDAVGMVFNTGIRQVSLEYWINDAGEKTQVGASTDSIKMGEFREIGCGPGVEWHIRTYRGTEERRHKELRK